MSNKFPDLLIEKITSTQINDQVNVLNNAFGGKQHNLGTDSKITWHNVFIINVQYNEQSNFYLRQIMKQINILLFTLVKIKII